MHFDGEKIRISSNDLLNIHLSMILSLSVDFVKKKRLHYVSLVFFGTLYRYTTEQTDFSLFETLRESIYSEVATLISQNENRPHFLIELFRELQGLTTDYLRQRVLYSVRDILAKQLTEQASTNNSRVMEAVSRPLC